MIRALGKADIDSVADSLPGDGLYAIERVEEWADANAEWIIADSLSFSAHEAVRVPETLAWAHNIMIQTLEMTWGVWQAAQKLPWEWANDQRKIAFMRHNLTNYPLLLKDLAAMPGCREGYLILRLRVDETSRGLLRD